jgi:hypothetical protein
MSPKKDKVNRHKSIKIVQKQKLKLRYVVAAGSAALLTLLLILYFNLSKNEEMKAKENDKEEVSELPSSLKIDQQLIMPATPEMRGMQYKSVREEKDFSNLSN